MAGKRSLEFISNYSVVRYDVTKGIVRISTSHPRESTNDIADLIRKRKIGEIVAITLNCPEDPDVIYLFKGPEIHAFIYAWEEPVPDKPKRTLTDIIKEAEQKS